MSSPRTYAVLQNIVSANNNGVATTAEVGPYRNFIFATTATNVTTGANVAIEAQLGPGGAYFKVDDRTIAANGNTVVQIQQAQFENIRANIHTWTDGNYTVAFSAGT